MKRAMRFLPLLLLAACFSVSQYGEAHVQRLCLDDNYAYETGYNVGRNGGNLDTSWVVRCAPERSEGIRVSYQAGYHQGSINAPIVVRGEYTVNSEPAYYPRPSYSRSYSRSYSSAECTFSSDCGEDRTCRSGVCYGQGWAGAACMFSSDCLSDDCDHSANSCR